MEYGKIELDHYHKAIICPVCGNEEPSPGEYCPICGNHIVNRCVNSSCGELLDGYARYCNICGEPSTFGEELYLAPYGAEIEAIEAPEEEEIDPMNRLPF